MYALPCEHPTRIELDEMAVFGEMDFVGDCWKALHLSIASC
jgi:hypothetical protein